MKKIGFELTGLSPLMIHNIQLANPLGKYTMALKQLTSKRNKTDTDVREITRLEWEAGLYLDDGIVVMPTKCLAACFFAGAKKNKNGPKWREGCQFDQYNYPLKYKGPKIEVKQNGQIPNPELDKYYDKYVNLDMVRVGTSSTLRARPIFEQWGVDVGIDFDEALIDRRTIIQIAADAGYRIGLCERRPQKGGLFGRFEVKAV